MIESWTKEDFEGRVGERFTLHLDAQPVPLDLVQVKAGAAPPRARAQFSLLFRAPRAALRKQGIFRVEHPDLGTHDLFLVAVGLTPEGGEGGGVLYEAVFT